MSVQLLYIWIEDDGMTIHKQGFNFSSRFKFSLEPGKKKPNSLELKISENEQFVQDFFNIEAGSKAAPNPPARIMEVTAVIGKNGVGKTNLFEFLIRVLIGKIHFGEKYVLALLLDDSIHIYHSLDTTIRTNKRTNSGVTIAKAKREKIKQLFVGNIHRTNSYALPASSVIYYNPAFDFRNYPPRISWENLDYIDVSTTTLVDQDRPFLDTYISSEENKILIHKFSNLKRYFELSVLNSQLVKLGDLSIPADFEIVFYRDSFDPDKAKRNLKYNVIKIFKDLNKLIDPAFSRVHSKMHTFEEKARKAKKDFSLPLEYYKQVAEMVKIEFTFCMIHNYFKNLNVEFEVDIGLENYNIGNRDLFRASKDFFQKQTLISSSAELLDRVYKAIDKTDFSAYSFMGSEYNSFSINTAGAKEILTLYARYFFDFPGKTKRSFINMDWRNISTGEKAKLDLYSRLLYAKSLSKHDADCFYILIDEGELGYHPQWQKSYLNDLLKFIQACFVGNNVQLFLTSHSPFLASDLPSDNIILLKKNKDQGCEVLDASREHSFGANIHGLFRDSFFLEDGLIGEFAKNKITEVFELLNKRSINDEESKHILKLIKTIGDPMIRNRLMEKYSMKVGEDYEERLLETQRDELDERLKSIRKKRNDLDSK